MLKKIRANVRPHWIEDEVNSFSACKFGGGNEVTVSRNQNYLVDLMLIRQRSYVHTDFHVHALLLRIENKIPFRKVFNFNFACEQRFSGFRTQIIIHLFRHMPETKGKFAPMLQFLHESRSPCVRIRFVQINVCFAQWMVHALAADRFTIVIEDAV